MKNDQCPMTKSQRMSNSQGPMSKKDHESRFLPLVIDHSSLVILWSVVIGNWSFVSLHGLREWGLLDPFGTFLHTTVLQRQQRAQVLVVQPLQPVLDFGHLAKQ